jgi:hypothetical protein
MLSGMSLRGKVLTFDACRSKADEYLRAAEANTDPKSQECFRRTADAWIALALHAKQHPLTLSKDPFRRLGDALRERLDLTEVDDTDAPDSSVAVPDSGDDNEE